LKLRIHRGTHEIGGTCIEVWTNETRIVLDIGMPLVNRSGEPFDKSQIRDFSSEDLVSQGILPPVKGLYGHSNEVLADAVVISHPHLDHYGLGSYVSKDVPFFIGKDAHLLVDLTSIFMGGGLTLENAKHYSHRATFEVGDISVTPFLMDHSAFDAYALLIENDDQKIFYTGDFREHGRKSKLMQYLEKNPPSDINTLLMEGTNITQEDFRFYDEEAIQGQFEEAMKDADGLVLIQVSGQNIDRLVSIYKAVTAKESGRVLVLDSYTALVLTLLSKNRASLPHPSPKWQGIKVYFYPGHFNLLHRNAPELVPELNKLGKYKITTEEINARPNNYAVIMRAGESARRDKLERMPDIDGGTFIYSMWKGYLVQPRISEFVDYLKGRDYTIKHIHTSGHADIPTLQHMVDIVNPELLIPIHTFNPELFKEHFSVPVKVLEDGEVFSI